jgi:autotransporter passenger strand-loop-strand repeat protein
MADYVVSGGQVSSGIVLNPGDTLTVLSDGAASAAFISVGAIETVSSGGADFTAGDDGTQIVEAGAFSSGTTLSDDGMVGSVLEVFGTAIGTEILRADAVLVESGGSTTGTLVASGQEFVSAGGLSMSSTILTGGENIYGSAIRTTVSAGGAQSVLSGGISVSATLSGGSLPGFSGTEIVYTGGTASATTINGGGLQQVESGGIAIGVVVDSQGTEAVSGGTVAGVVVNGGGTQVFGGGGLTGTETVSSGGTTVSPAIDSSGLLDLKVGAVVSGGVTFAAPAGGRLEIEGTASPAYTISGFAPGDTVDLANLAFASSSGATLSAGNVLHVTGSGGSSINLQFDPSQSFSGDTFHLAQDSPAAARWSASRCGRRAISMATAPRTCCGAARTAMSRCGR